MCSIPDVLLAQPWRKRLFTEGLLERGREPEVARMLFLRSRPQTPLKIKAHQTTQAIGGNKTVQPTATNQTI